MLLPAQAAWQDSIWPGRKQHQKETIWCNLAVRRPPGRWSRVRWVKSVCVCVEAEVRVGLLQSLREAVVCLPCLSNARHPPWSAPILSKFTRKGSPRWLAEAAAAALRWVSIMTHLPLLSWDFFFVQCLSFLLFFFKTNLIIWKKQWFLFCSHLLWRSSRQWPSRVEWMTKWSFGALEWYSCVVNLHCPSLYSPWISDYCCKTQGKLSFPQ